MASSRGRVRCLPYDFDDDLCELIRNLLDTGMVGVALYRAAKECA